MAEVVPSAAVDVRSTPTCELLSFGGLYFVNKINLNLNFLFFLS